MDELVALTDEVQNGEVEFRGKTVTFQFCELAEKEEPKMKMPRDNMSEQEKMDTYQKIGSQRVKAMLEKANKKNPDGPVLDVEKWNKLPTTLRYSISNVILGVEETAKENFTL